MKVRIVVAAALALGVAFGTAGCNLIQPQATTTPYDASDGVGINVGDLSLRNLMIISDNGETGNLLLSASRLLMASRPMQSSHLSLQIRHSSFLPAWMTSPQLLFPYRE